VMQRLAAEKNQKAAQFKPGNAESAKGGLAKAGKLQVTMNSESPAPEPERDRKASNAKTTVGQIAAAAGVTGTRTVGRASTENAPPRRAGEALLAVATGNQGSACGFVSNWRQRRRKRPGPMGPNALPRTADSVGGTTAPDFGKRDKNGTQSFFGFARTCVSFSLSMGRPTGLEPATPRFTIFRLLVRSYPLVSVSDTPK